MFQMELLMVNQKMVLQMVQPAIWVVKSLILKHLQVLDYKGLKTDELIISNYESTNPVFTNICYDFLIAQNREKNLIGQQRK